jgi:hypothetical protein
VSPDSTPEVLGDVQAALAEVGATPAVAETLGTTVETDLPASANDAAAVTTPAGTLTMEVPAEGRDLNRHDNSTAVFEGTGEDTAIAVQATEAGVRALVHIESADAPERFEFPIGGDVSTVRLTADGGAEALDADGALIATAAPPWATDATGDAVPTDYEIDGTTLVQIVMHRQGDYDYGIVADPVWAVIIAVAAICAENVLLSVPSQALADIYHGHASSKQSYVENAIASCLVGPMGSWVWKFLPGATKSWLIRQVLYIVIYIIRRL